MFHALRGRDERGVLNGRIALSANYLLPFANEALHCLAGLMSGRTAKSSKCYVQAADMISRLL